MADYCPDAGDVVWLEFDPQSGREQAGRRPALVLSPKSYNQRSGLMLCVPLTSKIKGYPFEVRLTLDDLEQVALADHVKSLDFRARSATFKSKAAPEVLEEVRGKLRALI